MKWLKSILFTSILFNPIALLVLFESYWVATFIPFVMVIGGYFFQRVKCFRVLVWAFNIFAIVGIFLNVELIFRTLYSDKCPPNIYEVRGNYYFNRPNLEMNFEDDEFSCLYKTNFQGYRISKDSNQTDTVKQCDWLFVGDSFTQGGQVDYEELFSTLCYHDFPDKVIVNAGMSGAGLYESLNFIKDKGRELKPSRIFLQIGAFNDFYNIMEHRASWKEYLMEKSELFRFIQYNISESSELPLGRWTEPFFSDREENERYNIFYKSGSAQKLNDRAAFKHVISQFKKEADHLGAELVILLVPSKEQTSDALLKEVTRAFSINAQELDMLATNQLTAETCQANEIEFIDLYQPFRDAEIFPFFQRDEHLNASGHKLIAQVIKDRFASESQRYSAFSPCNHGERYPSFFDEGMSVLFQSQQDGIYYIKTSNILRTREQVLWDNKKQLIHPAISQDGQWLVFTHGDQNRGDTDVILHDFVSGKDKVINIAGTHGAIPSFSHDSKLMAYPQWVGMDNPNIVIYDIANGLQTASVPNDGMECWRPIFSNDDSSVYYLKMNAEGRFDIMAYDIGTGKVVKLYSAKFNIWDISLSPSGNKLAFAGYKDGNWDLFLLDIPSKALKQLTKSIGNDWDPVFQSEDELWFAGEYGFNNGIYHMRLP